MTQHQYGGMQMARYEATLDRAISDLSKVAGGGNIQAVSAPGFNRRYWFWMRWVSAIQTKGQQLLPDDLP